MKRYASLAIALAILFAYLLLLAVIAQAARQETPMSGTMFAGPIEAVTVCKDYGDYLAEVAAHNRRLLDRWVVVTAPEDEETRSVCCRNSIEVVLCTDFTRGGSFNKARGINAGLRQLRGDGWLLHLDGDVCLPLDFRQCLDDADLRSGSIHGCNRLCVPGPAAWDALQLQGLYSRMNGWLTEFRDRPPGCYVGGVPAGIGNGYVPIGFFQLWWGAETLSWGSARKWYPQEHGGAARTDTQFASLWDRSLRVQIPELLVFHLEHENAKDGMGHNWRGRKTPKFRNSVLAGNVQARAYP